MTKWKNSSWGISIHHKVPVFHSGNRHFNNLVKLSELKHRALHILTDVEWLPTMPIEHIEQHLSMMWLVYIDDFRQDVSDIIEIYWEEAYNPKCFKK